MSVLQQCENLPPTYDFMMYDGSDEVYNWIKDVIGDPDDGNPRPYPWVTRDNDTNKLTIATHFGLMACSVGDYVLRDGANSFKPYTAEVFQASFRIITV